MQFLILLLVVGLFLTACEQGLKREESRSSPSQAEKPAPQVEKLQSPIADRHQPPVVEKVGNQGKVLFETNCAVCHGVLGKGDSFVATKLSTKPTDLTFEATQKKSDVELKKIITKGISKSMPPWRHFSDAERDALVIYIRELGRGK